MTFELARDEIQVAAPAVPVALPHQSRAPAAYPSAPRIPAQRRAARVPARRGRRTHIGFTAFVLGMITLAIGVLPYAGVVPSGALGPFAVFVPYIGFVAVIPGAAGLLFTIAAADNLRRRVANNHVSTILGGLTSIAGILVPWLFLVLALVHPSATGKADTGLSEFSACLDRAMTTEEVNACS